MPRYFFHAEDHRLISDTEGVELDGLEAARDEAVHRACKLLTANPQQLWETKRWRLLATDADARILFTIEIRPEAGVNVVPWRATG